MKVELNGFELEVALLARRDGQWMTLPLVKTDRGARVTHKGVEAELSFGEARADRIGYSLRFAASFRTRVRMQAKLMGQKDLFHLIPGNIHGDNNAAHVRAGEFPCLTKDRPADRNCAG